MGIFSGIKDSWDDFRGATGAKAAQQAAQVQSDAYGQVGESYQPMVDFGMQAMPGLTAGATAGGMGGEIGSIMSGQGFGALVNERQRAADAQLAGAGLRRSGAAAQTAANIPASLAMQMEQELNRRRQSNMGYGMQGLQGQNSAILGGAGADASGLLGAAQARSQGLGNVMNLAGQVGGALATGGASLLGSMGGGIGSIFGGGGSPGSRPGDYTGGQMQDWIGRQ